MNDVDTLRRLNAQEQRLGQIYDQIACTYVPLTTARAEVGGGLAGGVLNVGTYSVGPVGGGATYSFNYPTTAKAVVIKLQARWAVAAAGSYASAGVGLDVFALAANIGSAGSGIIPLDTSGRFNIVVAGANSTVFYCYLTGYFL